MSGLVGGDGWVGGWVGVAESALPRFASFHLLVGLRVLHADYYVAGLVRVLAAGSYGVGYAFAPPVGCWVRLQDHVGVPLGVCSPGEWAALDWVVVAVVVAVGVVVGVFPPPLGGVGFVLDSSATPVVWLGDFGHVGCVRPSRDHELGVCLGARVPPRLLSLSPRLRGCFYGWAGVG